MCLVGTDANSYRVERELYAFYTHTAAVLLKKSSAFSVCSSVLSVCPLPHETPLFLSSSFQPQREGGRCAGSILPIVPLPAFPSFPMLPLHKCFTGRIHTMLQALKGWHRYTTYFLFCLPVLFFSCIILVPSRMIDDEMRDSSCSHAHVCAYAVPRERERGDGLHHGRSIRMLVVLFKAGTLREREGEGEIQEPGMKQTRDEAARKAALHPSACPLPPPPPPPPFAAAFQEYHCRPTAGHTACRFHSFSDGLSPPRYCNTFSAAAMPPRALYDEERRSRERRAEMVNGNMIHEQAGRLIHPSRLPSHSEKGFERRRS